MATQVLPTRINVNQLGIPTVGQPFRGIVVVRLNQAIPTGTTTTLPIVFTSDSSNTVNLVGFNGDNVTVADIQGTGIYLIFVDSQSNIVQLLTGIV